MARQGYVEFCVDLSIEDYSFIESLVKSREFTTKIEVIRHLIRKEKERRKMA